MNFGEVIQYGFKNYANFSGVVSRRIYWNWYLFVVLCQVPFSVLSSMTYRLEDSTVTMLVSAAANLVSVGLLVPSLALMIRRLRDAGKSPLYLLLWLAPIAFAVVFGLGGVLLGAAVGGSSSAGSFVGGMSAIVFGLGGAGLGAIVGGLGAAIWLIVLLAQPTKYRAQGNRYAEV